MRGEEVKSILQLNFSKFGTGDVVTVSLVNDNTVGHFHDASLDALQFIPGSGNLYQQEEIDHRMYGSFTLTDPDGFNQGNVKSGSLAEQHGLSRFAGNAAQRAGRWGRADVGVWITG